MNLKRLLAAVLFLHILVPAFAQEPKNGYVIVYGKERPDSGIPADGKVEEGNYVNNRKEGKWIKYHADGKTPKLIGNYSNNRPVGDFKKYYENGQLKEEGTFTNNKYVDSLKRYHENGQLEYAAFYNSEGKEEGTVRYYYATGQLQYEYFARNGQITYQKRFETDGDIASQHKEAVDSPTNISLDEAQAASAKTKVKAPSVGASPKTKQAKWQPNGYNKVYNDNDEIWQDGTFQDGQLWNGKLYVYDRDQILVRVKVFKEGYYFSDGQL